MNLIYSGDLESYLSCLYSSLILVLHEADSTFLCSADIRYKMRIQLVVANVFVLIFERIVLDMLSKCWQNALKRQCYPEYCVIDHFHLCEHVPVFFENLFYDYKKERVLELFQERVTSVIQYVTKGSMDPYDFRDMFL